MWLRGAVGSGSSRSHVTGAPLVAVLWERRVEGLRAACLPWPLVARAAAYFGTVAPSDIRYSRWPLELSRTDAASKMAPARRARPDRGSHGGWAAGFRVDCAGDRPSALPYDGTPNRVAVCATAREGGVILTKHAHQRSSNTPTPRTPIAFGSDCQPAPASAFAAGLFVPAG